MLLALPERPTAVVAASDLMALAALQAIRDAGLQPGEDVAVVGFDDLEAAALAHPPLTTIRQDRQELGTLAAARAIELIEDPEAAPRGDDLARRARRARLHVLHGADGQPVAIGDGCGARGRLLMKSRYQ